MENEYNTRLIINPNIKNIYGFLILDAKSLLIGTVTKDNKEINIKNEIFFREARKGTYDCHRFQWVYRERIANTVKLIDNNLERIFIKDNKLNISGLIIAGSTKSIKRYLTSAYHKKDLNKFIITYIELNHGGEIGFNEAIKLSMINC